MSKQLSIHMRSKPKNWMWLPIQEKKCTKCSEIKHLTEFHRHNTRRNVGGRRYQCITCIRKYDQKRHSDITKQLKYGCENRIARALRDRGLLLPEYINDRFDLIGCTVEELMDHLQKQFLPGMSWDTYRRYDGWCMDHIKPIAMFDLTDRAQIEECFHYTNIQPLWFRDNSRKSSFYNGVRYSYQ